MLYKAYGEHGKESATMKEIKNLVLLECFGKVEYESLTVEQRLSTLPILMFMVEKQNGDLKTRGCADGRQQRLWTNKNDVLLTTNTSN